MKSIFQEASTLGKAVQKAWEDAGSPNSFSIKVLKVGEGGFFGFGGIPYTVSLSTVNTTSVDDRFAKKQAQPGQSNRSDVDKDTVVKTHSQKPSFKQGNKERSFERNDVKESRQEAKDFPRSSETNKTTSAPLAKRSVPKKAFAERSAVKPALDSSSEVEVIADNWTQALVDKADQLFREAVAIAGIDCNILGSSFEANNMTIKVAVKAEDDDLSANKSIFISLAPLVVQMAKRSSGEILRGLKLVVEVSSEN